MTINIDLRPEDEQELLERARMSGRDLAGYVHRVLERHLRTTNPERESDESANGANPMPEDLIDHEFIAYCAREVEGQDVPSIEEVRQMLSKIPGSMARAVIEEREDRF